jgi:hypothetical protein
VLQPAAHYLFLTHYYGYGVGRSMRLMHYSSIAMVSSDSQSHARTTHGQVIEAHHILGSGPVHPSVQRQQQPRPSSSSNEGARVSGDADNRHKTYSSSSYNTQTSSHIAAEGRPAQREVRTLPRMCDTLRDSRSANSSSSMDRLIRGWRRSPDRRSADRQTALLPFSTPPGTASLRSDAAHPENVPGWLRGHVR